MTSDTAGSPSEAPSDAITTEEFGDGGGGTVSMTSRTTPTRSRSSRPRLPLEKRRIRTLLAPPRRRGAGSRGGCTFPAHVRPATPTPPRPPQESVRPAHPSSPGPGRLLRLGGPRLGRDLVLVLRPGGGLPPAREPPLPRDLPDGGDGRDHPVDLELVQPDHRAVPERRRGIPGRDQAPRPHGGGRVGMR